MNDPAYDGEEPLESEEDYDRALKGHAHIPERVELREGSGPRWPKGFRVYECAKCGEPMYEVPRGVGEFIGA